MTTVSISSALRPTADRSDLRRPPASVWKEANSKKKSSVHRRRLRSVEAFVTDQGFTYTLLDDAEGVSPSARAASWYRYGRRRLDL